MQTRPCLRRIVSTEMCVDVRVLLYTYRCPCAKTHCEPNTVSPPPFSSLFLPLTLSVSLTSQHAARGQTCISLHSPLSQSFFIPSSFLPTPLPCISTFFCTRGGGGPKHERRQNVNAGACVDAHMVAVALPAIASVVVLTLMFSCVHQKLL